MHKLRKCSGVAAGLIAVFLLACPQFEASQAQAQTHAGKKKAERKAAAQLGRSKEYGRSVRWAGWVRKNEVL